MSRKARQRLWGQSDPWLQSFRLLLAPRDQSRRYLMHLSAQSVPWLRYPSDPLIQWRQSVLSLPLRQLHQTRQSVRSVLYLKHLSLQSDPSVQQVRPKVQSARSVRQVHLTIPSVPSYLCCRSVRSLPSVLYQTLRSALSIQSVPVHPLRR